ncbi:hypothetical protein [Bythopirellula goksoeyrii]|nr:hypothetical protein [Bythopirellula goksoeyrii]
MKCRSYVFSAIAPKMGANIGLSLVFAICCCLTLVSESVFADLTIDPNGTGATDVVQYQNAVQILLTNPLADPLDLGSDYIAVGNTASGALAIENGGSVGSVSSFIGYQAGSSGVVTIDGAGSSWSNTTGTNNSNFSVGHLGSGSLTITNGGTISNYHNGFIGSETGSLGEVTVNGAGSSWTSSGGMNVGFYGSGNLDISGGGAVSNNGQSAIGLLAGATGMATVAGTGSTWTTNSGLVVGSSGSGMLEITDSGQVTVGFTTQVARNSGSDGTISFDNGVLTTRNLIAAAEDLTGTGTINSQGLLTDVDLVFDTTHGLIQTVDLTSNPSQSITINLNVDGTGTLGAGHSSIGSMSVSDTVVVSSANGYIGYRSGSSGEVIVQGGGSTWNSGFLDVGNEGSGTLTISEGGMVNSSLTYIARRPGSNGVVKIDGAGSTWIANSPYIGESGNGKLLITAGGNMSNSGNSRIGHLTGSAGEASVDGLGSEWNLGGDLFVGGKGSGVLNITGGGLVRVDDTLWIASGNGGNGFVNVATGGQLALYGEGDDSLSHFLSLTIGSDAARYWDHSLLDWAPITAATYGDDFSLAYHDTGDLAGYTVLTVGLAGDFDGNNKVNGLDFLKWQRGETPQPLSAAELADWEANYGTNIPISSTAVVPESSSFMLAVLALIVSLHWRHSSGDYGIGLPCWGRFPTH